MLAWRTPGATRPPGCTSAGSGTRSRRTHRAAAASIQRAPITTSTAPASRRLSLTTSQRQQQVTASGLSRWSGRAARTVSSGPRSAAASRGPRATPATRCGTGQQRQCRAPEARQRPERVGQRREHPRVVAVVWTGRASNARSSPRRADVRGPGQQCAVQLAATRAAADGAGAGPPSTSGCRSRGAVSAAARSLPPTASMSHDGRASASCRRSTPTAHPTRAGSARSRRCGGSGGRRRSHRRR